MEIKGAIVPDFRPPAPPPSSAFLKGNKYQTKSCLAKVSSSAGDAFTFPGAYTCWRTLETLCGNTARRAQQPSIARSNISGLPNLSFDRMQCNEQELGVGKKRVFGRFVARGAVLDEEYWTAAWLRAESHWESLSYMRHVESYKWKYAEQEFYALKHRCSAQDGNSLKCFCIIAVKTEEENLSRTILSSVVGTLDLSIRQFLQGETFPGEFKKASAVLMNHEACDAHRYAYMANVCVSKYARRWGIATNMISLATDIASAAGMRQLYVHVNIDNKPAQELYRKVGFKVVEADPPTKRQQLLMLVEM